MSVFEDHWNNDKYGFPDGVKRRVKRPRALACIHITGNRRTAKNPDLRRAARDEYDHAKRKAPPSAHYYVARDGFAIEAIDPIKFAAWSNGDIKNPDTSNRGVRRVLRLADRGRNPNEAYWLEFECVGFGARHRITSEQKQTVAEIIATHARLTGLPINRDTVHGHGDLNSITRSSCPVRAVKRETFMADVIARANAVLNPPTESPVMPGGEPMVIVTDDTAFDIDLRPGAKITDLNGEPIEEVQGAATRLSPFGTAGARAVITVVGGSTMLGLVKEDGVLAQRLPPTASEEDLEAARAAGHAEGFQEARSKAAEVTAAAIQGI
jgi:hypothetical protein